MMMTEGESLIQVLIVEDDPMVAKLNKEFLAKIPDFAVAASVRSANEALGILETQSIDLIILDIFMPGMNGFDLLAQIRSLEKRTDVILVTAASDKSSIEKALRFGVVDYLIKPFEFERFQAALIHYRERVRFMNRPDEVSQDELDQHLFTKEQSPGNDALPKGLDRKTLKTVWDGIRAWDGKVFSTDEIAGQVGLSRVSMRKYLDFFQQIGVLSLEVNYGSVGRPVYKYRLIGTADSALKRFLN